VNRRERIGGAIYVVVFFISGVFLSVWLLLLPELDVSHIFSRKDAIETKRERRVSFNRLQQEAVLLSDRLVQKISKYDPGVTAIYEKNDIQYDIDELYRQYEEKYVDVSMADSLSENRIRMQESNVSKKRYLVFLHMSDFYQMWFRDRQDLWCVKTNIELGKANLHECELGVGVENNTLRR
jgi:hypothetical protein